MEKSSNNRLLLKKKIGFPSTMWTDIVRWEKASNQDRKDLLHRFYQRYKLPLLCFLKYNGLSADEAEDVFHDFITSHIEGKLFISADPTRGRFRNLLFTSLKYFLSSRKRAEYANKRRPSGGFTYLDEEIAEGLHLKDLLEDWRTPEEIYERAWLIALLNNVLERLRLEYQTKGQDKHYVLFERKIIQPIIHGAEKPSLQKLSAELGMSASEGSNCIVTAKRAYKRHLREEILEYVSSDKEVSEEINDFICFLRDFNS